jgi:hypothetical protein
MAKEYAHNAAKAGTVCQWEDRLLIHVCQNIVTRVHAFKLFILSSCLLPTSRLSLSLSLFVDSSTLTYRIVTLLRGFIVFLFPSKQILSNYFRPLLLHSPNFYFVSHDMSLDAIV